MVRLRKRDKERLELICATLGFSKAAVFRMSLAMLSGQLGFEGDRAGDLFKKKSPID